MENDDVKQALQICFGCIIDLYEERQSGGIVGVLLYFLASVVYHMDAFVKPVIEKQPNHPFSAIPLLQYPGLLQRLQKFVTLDRTDNMPQATGIPPHIDHSQKLSEILLKVTQITSMMMHQTEEIKASVVQAIEEHDIRGGVITIDFLNNRLKEHHKQLEQVLCDQLQQGGITNDQVTRPLPEQEHQQGQQKGIDHTLYYYDGKFWQVPRGWQFPEKILRRTGWSLWLNGQPGIVRPFRLLDPPSLSPDKKLRDRLKLEWRPIFQMMEQAPDMEIPTGSHNVTPEFVEQSFLQGTYYLKARAGYVWEHSTRPEVLTISSWSKHVQRSNIEKFGNDNDRANLPPPDRHNAPHSNKRQRRRQLAPKVLDQRRRVCQRHNSP